jgi:hypothetical protein
MGDGTASHGHGALVRSGGDVRCQHPGLRNAERQTSPDQCIDASRLHDGFGNLVASLGIGKGPLWDAEDSGSRQRALGLKRWAHRHCDVSTGRSFSRMPIKDGRGWDDYRAEESAPTTFFRPIEGIAR